MKLYIDKDGTAPSPRRVRIYLAEKGIEVPYERLAIHDENRTDAFRAKNPMYTMPVLELDDGTCIAESLAICRYFEALHPEPPLFGRTPLEMATIEMWARRCELQLYLPLDLAGVLPPETRKAAFEMASRTMEVLDEVLAEREFIADDRYTIADVVTQGAIDYGIAYRDVAIDPKHEHLARWYRQVSARPGAKA